MSQAFQYLLEKYGVTMTFQQAQEQLHCCIEVLENILRDKKIEAVKRGQGRKWIILTESFFKYIESLKVKQEEDDEQKPKVRRKLVGG
jgi:CTP:phosphocholine cytidylyltransferase-like protein